MNLDRSYRQPLKDGRSLLVICPEVHRDEAGDTCDMLLCPWCNQKPFVIKRRWWRVHLYGRPSRAFPSCGCNKGFQVQCDWEAIGEDYRAGLPYRNIMKKHGVSCSTVQRIRRKLGIPNRK